MIKAPAESRGIFKKAKECLLELFFPSHCAFCNRIGYFLCPSCQGKIIKIKGSTCLGCNKLTEKGRICPTCQRKTKLTGLIAAGYFKDEVLKETIHQFKYEKIAGIANILAQFLIEKLEKEKISFDLVFYVPITKKREAWRGFNQAELLAKDVSAHFQKDLGSMIKTKETKTQVGLARKERVKNIKSAFDYRGPEINGKRILLIDDVFTTGATLNECASVLKGKGARTVWAAVVAKE